MESYRLISKLDYSEDLNKDIALKYDAGKVKSEKYGEAALSVHFLLSVRHGEYPPVYTKQMEEISYVWMKKMGLEECEELIINKIKVPRFLSLSAPGIDPEKLELYFKVMVFEFLYDDAVTKLNYPNEKGENNQQEDAIKLIENLVFIIRNHGSCVATEAAISNLSPLCKSSCISLSHTCRQAFEEMCKDDYEWFAREMMDFVRVSKWMLECHNSPYSESEYLFLRRKDCGLYPVMESIFFANDLRISNEIRMHPLFQKYLEIVSLHTGLCNDVFSLSKETQNNERENIVLIKCEKYNLQKAIYEAEKDINKLMLEVKKCGIKLMLYFPSDKNLKDLVRAMEFLLDGCLYWYQDSRRYGDAKYEKYVVEYDCNYSWLKNVEHMREHTLIQ